MRLVIKRGKLKHKAQRLVYYRTAMKTLIWIAILVCATAVYGQQQETLVIRAAQMLDVRNGKIIPNPVVVVKGDKIVSLDSKDIPSNATIVELPNTTLLPGLIDTHTHLTYDAGNYWLDIGRQPHSYSSAYALVGAKNARITLLAGFTTVRDLGACCFADVNVMKAIEKNLIEGPSMVVAGNIIATTGSACDQTTADPTTPPGPQYGIGDDITTLVQAVRLQIRNGARVIKICADQNNFSQEEMDAISQAAHQRRVKLAVHVWEEDSIRKGIRAGADSIEHAGIMPDELLDEMVKKGIYLVPTMYTSDTMDLTMLKPEVRAKIEQELPLFEDSFKRALKKGVKMAFGSDSGQIPHGENAKEFDALVKRGMTPLHAIQSATIHAADLLGFTDRGEIKTGLRADLIAVQGNPLEKIQTLEKPVFVMKTGKIYRKD